MKISPLLLLFLVSLGVLGEVPPPSEVGDGEGQSPTAPVHHLTIHKGCRSKPEVVTCFQTCWDEFRVSSMYRAAVQLRGKTVNITEFMWKERWKVGKSRFGCLVGCLTNTALTTCKGRCTPPLIHFVGEKCIYDKEAAANNPFRDAASGGLVREEFKQCYVDILNDTEVEISLCDRNTSSLKRRTVEENRKICVDMVDECFGVLNDPSEFSPETRTVEQFNLCVEYKLMEKHIQEIFDSNLCDELFHHHDEDSEGGPPPSEAELKELKDNHCDEVLATYLPNELCEKLCFDTVPPSPFDECVGECDTKTYPLCYDGCATQAECFNDCLLPPEPPGPPATSTTTEVPTTPDPNIGRKRRSASTLSNPSHTKGDASSTVPRQTLHCFARCVGSYDQLHTVYEQFGTKVLTGTKRTTAARSCRVEPKMESIKMLAGRITDLKSRHTVFDGYEDEATALDNYGWLFKMKTPDECKLDCNDETGNHRDECLRDSSCTSDLSLDTREKLCDDNPLRLLMLVKYAEARMIDLKRSSVEATYADGKGFSGYTYDPNDNVTNQKFFDLIGIIQRESDCNKNCETPDEHGVANAQCAINCFYTHRERCEHTQLKTVDLSDFSSCQWIINLSYTSDPLDILGTYFNDKASYDEKDKLERPETTQYLQQTTLRGSTGYFVFPYFIIVRATCDEGNYDDAFYRLMMAGTYPTVIVHYFPNTARDQYQSELTAKFASSLIDLKRNPDDILVPINPLEKGTGAELEDMTIDERWCHLKICYPAFAIPLPMYQLATFEVIIEAQDVFEKLDHHMFVTSFHLTSATGSGELYVSDAHENVVSVASPEHFFPHDRVTKHSDAMLAEYDAFCQQTACPPIIDEDVEALTDHEDILEPHFTNPTSPQIAIAGFYSPNLLIIGDPDMNKYDLVNWTIPTPKHNISMFGKDNPCVYTKEFSFVNDHGETVNLRTSKPMYSKVDMSDATYPIVYYRMRYKPKNYAEPPNGHGIFDVVALADRFLLITANGLVSMYGNTNDTLSVNRAFKVEESEKVKKCFKFMRAARRAQSFSDNVVGVTYNYDKRIETHTENVRQEIWFGRLVKNGESLRWTQLKSASVAEEDLDVEYSIPSSGDAGSVVPISPGKPLKPPEFNADEFSEVERICFKVYKERINLRDVNIHHLQPGWCEALDATPVVTKKDTIQLLIRMTVVYVGPGTSGTGTKIVFYVLVSHTVDGEERKTNRNEQVLWMIDSILPRIPCIDAHKESVRNLMMYDETYFSMFGPTDDGTGFEYGCHQIFAGVAPYHVYVNRLTYTATYTSNLFLYGSKLIQSTDGGKSFVNTLHFPHTDNFLPENNPHNLTDVEIRLSHRIVTMAFGQTGQFAFLTNKRELWIGNTGSTEQYRIRPSTGYSVTQILVSHTRGLQDGVPFALLYEQSEELFEMVTMPESNKNVGMILKRRVPVALILRQIHLQNAIQRRTTAIAVLPDKPKFVAFKRTEPEWYLYCAFSSPQFQENYTETYSRNQVYSFAPPIQHPYLSDFKRDLRFNALITYQVVSFSLTWKAFFDNKYTAYSRLDRDPFGQFHREKEDNSTIGQLSYLSIGRDDSGVNDELANTNGILLFPHQYGRESTDEPSRAIQTYYYLDYGNILRLKLKFSIKDPSSLANTDYFTQRISQIQINVDSGNGSLLLIDTDKDILASEASVQFDIFISVIKSESVPLVQSEPGRNLLPVPIHFHLIGAFGQCVQTSQDPLVRDTHRTTIYVGCLPGTDILFNWNATLHSIQFRDKKQHYGKGDDCYGNELVCFFSRTPMILFFDIYDISKQAYIPYTGNYIMRVVGGGYSKKTIGRYQKQEIDAYNIPGVSDVSLIWNEWDLAKQKKVDRRSNMWSDSDAPKIKDTSKEVVLQSGKSAIQWACHTLSPCARISPNINLQTVYWFEIQFTNKDVDNSTLCLFNKNFTIMLYGFPPSPETQLLTTILFCLCMIGILYLLFICLRGHKRVWRTTKIKLYGWYQIVKDTFPKPLKKHQAEVVTDGHTQQEKDNIILSLQGHLKIPPLVGRTDSSGAVGSGEASPGGEHTPGGSRKSRREVRGGSAVSIVSSGASIDSRYSKQSQAEVLHPVAARHGPATWTDMVYEQIIAKRLSAIVDKNNKMRQNILRRVSLHDGTTEHESNYEKTHKRTVSQESIFAQPK